MTAETVYHAIREGDVSYFEIHPEQIQLKNPHAGVEGSASYEEISPLHAAAAAGQLDAVKRLVELGGEVYSHPLSSYPAIMQAAWAGQNHVVDYFLDEIPHLALGTLEIGITCNLACRQGWLKQVKMHLERDPLAVHQRGWIGDVPLHWAGHNGYIEIVQLLLEHGANPNIEENNWIGGTPLHWASERHADIVKLMLDAGADPNAQVTRPGSEYLGGTPLHWCARQHDDCAEVAEILISAGTNVNTVDAFGKTAKNYAGPKVRSVLS